VREQVICILLHCTSASSRWYGLRRYNRTAPLASALETLACCYLPAVPSVRALPLLLTLPKLRRLDFRKTMADVSPLTQCKLSLSCIQKWLSNIHLWS
jgi:hypothetical protein